MTAGVYLLNLSDELTFSSDAFMYKYLGGATYSSTTAPTATAAGYSTYTISWAGQIIVGISLKGGGTGFSRRIRSMTQVGSVWTIIAEAGDGTVDSNGFHNQEQAFVAVWGLPLTMPSFGFVIKDGSGNLKADLSAQPFAPGNSIAFSSTDLTRPVFPEVLDGITYAPILVGHPMGTNQSNTANGAFSGNVTYTTAAAGWYWDRTTSPNNVGRSMLQQTRSVVFEDVHVNASNESTWLATTVLHSWHDRSVIL